MTYAAYDDVAIYAIGASEDEAIENAKRETREPNGLFQVAPISQALFEQISADGWHAMGQSFKMDRATGRIVETTDD